jgi:hypothetical protein
VRVGVERPRVSWATANGLDFQADEGSAGSVVEFVTKAFDETEAERKRLDGALGVIETFTAARLSDRRSRRTRFGCRASPSRSPRSSSGSTRRRRSRRRRALHLFDYVVALNRDQAHTRGKGVTF